MIKITIIRAFLALLIFSSFISESIFAQKFQIEKQIDFCNHLIQEDIRNEAFLLLNKSYATTEKGINYLNYSKGWLYYKEKQLDSSAFYLSKVNLNSEFYSKAQFHAGYSHAYEFNFKKAQESYEAILTKDSLQKELKETQLAGLALLRRDYISYKKHQKNFSYKYYSMSKEQKQLDEFHNQMFQYKKKSPWLAAGLSALIPGAGKMYAGKIGSGVSALFTVGILGAIAAENISKNGIKDFKSILFGSLCGLAYASNIYGSYYAAVASKNEFYETMDYRIRFHMYVPLRNIFE